VGQNGFCGGCDYLFKPRYWLFITTKERGIKGLCGEIVGASKEQQKY
jgi:hypothetical protein